VERVRLTLDALGMEYQVPLVICRLVWRTKGAI